MSARTEYLRNETLKRGAGGSTSLEGHYLWLKGYYENRVSSVIHRRGIAKGYELAHQTPVIYPQQLIVGCPCYRQLSKDESEEMSFLAGRAAQMLSPLGGQASHMAVDYEKLLKLGTIGIKSEIKSYREKLDLMDSSNIEKDNFYLGCLASLDGLEKYAENYSVYATKLAEEETDLKRKKELYDISAITARVPKYPAKTFREAVQSIHFLTFTMEGLYQLGRPDRYLIEYYRNDIANGILNRDEALELITCLCILFNDYIPRGLAVGLMVGGRDGSGTDITNELTYLFLESIALTRMIYPGLCLCYNSDTPDDVLELACKLLGEGHSHPAIFNDDIVTKGLMYYGLPREHACEYIQSTCVEITPCKRSAVWVASPYHNINQYLLDVMSDPNIDCLCPDFESLTEKYKERLSAGVKNACLAENRTQLERRLSGGDPYVSCFVDNCLERGRDIDNGGALYNWIMPSFVGMSNLADSLMSIKKLVYENKTMTLSEFYAILKQNFEGNEILRQTILNKIDKYGNDIDEVDSIVCNITKWITDEVAKYKTYRADHFIPSLFCWVMHEALGRSTMATPDGRSANFPFGDGSGPAQGREKNGPTASVLSSTKWEHYPFIGGIAVNLKFAKSLFKEESLPKLMTLVKTYLKRGGFEVQINVVDRDTLLEAQKNPDLYRDLVVRIGGYSDYFVHVGKNMQDEIILRTEHEI